MERGAAKEIARVQLSGILFLVAVTSCELARIRVSLA